MDWEKYWNDVAGIDNHLLQVGRLNADEKTTIKQAAERIIHLLEITTADHVLDLCCGNGLLTNYISKTGVEITGIDLSERLIENAKNNSHNVKFIKQDAMNLKLNESFNKIYIAFSFQYFDSFDKGKKVIENILNHASSKAVIVLSDIPDNAKWGNHYNSLIKKFFYFKQKWLGKQTMGKFWSEHELNSICKSLNVVGEKIKQPEELPYSHYRFDYRIKKS